MIVENVEIEAGSLSVPDPGSPPLPMVNECEAPAVTSKFEYSTNSPAPPPPPIPPPPAPPPPTTKTRTLVTPVGAVQELLLVNLTMQSFPDSVTVTPVALLRV